ncbi:hypothetical protein PINS_up013053 [Pythium insidiosum]|nr:hypothetical protein PINS_up013053 [Pythium insidiosum]
MKLVFGTRCILAAAAVFAAVAAPPSVAQQIDNVTPDLNTNTNANPNTNVATNAPGATSAAPMPTSTSAAGSGAGMTRPPSPTNGSGVKCAFRYSLPTASNLQAELQKAAAAKANKTNPNGDPNGDPTKSPSKGSSSSTGSFSHDITAGSGAGATRMPNAGSTDGTKTPAPSRTPTTTTSPSATSLSPSATSTAPSTTMPTRTVAPSVTTVRPTTTRPSSGSAADATLVRRALQATNDVSAGDAVTTAPTSIPSPTQPASTPAGRATQRPGATSRPPAATSQAPSNAGATSAPPSSSSPSPTGTASSGSGAAGTATPSPSSTAPGQSQSQVVTGEFSCDASFYGAWKKLNLQCGGQDLDVGQAVAQTKCLIYSGTQQQVTSLKLCMSVCKFPKCANGTWDYASDDGFTSELYQGLNFADLVTSAGLSAATMDQATTAALSSLKLRSERSCAYENESSFGTCQCENYVPATDGKDKNRQNDVPPALQPPVNKGLGDANHWPDGLPKQPIDKAGIATSAIGSSAAAVSVAVGGVLSVTSGVMSTSAGVASGVSAGAGLSVAMAAVDLCQFSVMINQMNLDATPRLLQEMGRRMAPATFGFLPFGREDQAVVQSRRLAELAAPSTNQTEGMERYAKLIGVRVDMLFYITLAGVMALSVLPFVLCALLVAVAAPFVSDTREFARKWFDKAVGVLMMILILSEYVVGVTATFQICYSIQHNRVDAGLFLAIFALLFFAVGTIIYGWVVVKTNEDELRDLGTKDHFEKPVHARYGPLYDEYTFEGRFFFAPKLLLALFSGVTTGMIWMSGMWQVIVLLTLHIAFLVLLEVKHPYPTQFVQKTSSFVIIIKISALFLTLFLISSASSFQRDIPVDLRQGVGFAIIGLQVLVLVCLMIRQVYIFYVTWKLKQQDSQRKEQGNESFVPLGANLNHPQQQYNQQQQQQQYNHHNVAILGGNSSHSLATPMQQTDSLQTPDRFRMQPTNRRTHTVVVHEDHTPSRSARAAYQRHNEVDL